MEQGEVLFGKYKVECALGSGGMSSVYLATNMQLGNKWAVKHIENNSIALGEVEILQKLNHISLPKIADVFRDYTGTYIIESYIEGITLQNRLEERRDIDVGCILDWSLQLCDVLSYLHNLKPHSIVYRDLKPSNIMILADNRLVLIDFGISKIYKEYNSKDKMVAGTNAYAAPEQLVQGGSSDKRSDIYSLGMIMRHLCKCNSYIQEGTIKSSTIRHVKAIIAKCLERMPERRFQSIEALRYELDSAAEGFDLERAKDGLVFWGFVALSIIASSATYMLVLWGLLH